MNDLKFAIRRLLKNPGFTIRPPQCRRPDRVQFPQYCFRKPGHHRQYSYGGRAVAVLNVAPGSLANGKIVRTWHTEDWMTGLHQLGVFEK